MSQPKHLLAIHQWVSSIYFLHSKVNLRTMITFLASRLEDTQARATFHSTGRWFQMFPKRKKGREAAHRRALDSTKSWKRTNWNHTDVHSVSPLAGEGPVTGLWLWFISPGCVGRVWRMKEMTSLSLNTKPEDKRRSREGNTKKTICSFYSTLRLALFFDIIQVKNYFWTGLFRLAATII